MNKILKVLLTSLVIEMICVFSFILITSCGNAESPKDPGIEVEVRKIGNCEYIDNRTYFGYHVYTHKGDCKNPIHYKQLEKHE